VKNFGYFWAILNLDKGGLRWGKDPIRFASNERQGESR